MRRLVALAVVLVLLAASCAGGGSSPSTEATTTTQALWLRYYDWELKENVDQWTTNCRDIQEHFDYIHNIRDGLIRKYGHTGVQIMDYLYEIGKRMGCEDFQY